MEMDFLCRVLLLRLAVWTCEQIKWWPGGRSRGLLFGVSVPSYGQIPIGWLMKKEGFEGLTL